MLNLSTPDISDKSCLENSYNALSDKENVEIVTDELEKEKVFRQTIDNLNIPLNASFSFQNLFKLKTGNGCFYIAQCLVDYGYPSSRRGTQSFTRQYNFQVIGIANLLVDVGVTHLRPENETDKLIPHFFSSDINFDDAEKFNNKYYLVSTKKAELVKYFNKDFLSEIAKQDDILLATNGNLMFVFFSSVLSTNQTNIVQQVLSSFILLAK